MFSRLKTVYRLSPAIKRCITTTTVQRSGHVELKYRTAPARAPKINYQLAEVFGGLMWWWILWHLWTEPGHVFGEFDIPDPNKWTDAELGIPPDEDDVQ